MKFIWQEGKRNVMNYSLAFAVERKDAGKAILRLAAANSYRVFEDGELIAYGPARAAHGYIREDYIPLRYDSRVIVVEVTGYNVNSYYFADDLPFFGAEITVNDKIVADTDDFGAYELTDKIVRIQRYSFQRPFAEAYCMESDRTNFYTGDFFMFPRVETEYVEGNIIIPRNIPYLKYEREPIGEPVETGEVVSDEKRPVWEDRCLHKTDTLKGYDEKEWDVRLSDEASKFIYSKRAVDGLVGGTYRVYDIGRTLTGFFELELSAKRDSVFYILWDEIDWHEQEDDRNTDGINVCFYRNTCCNIIKYSLKAGEYHLINYEPDVVKYIRIVCVEGELDLRKFSFIKYENPMAYNLSFTCKDKKLEAIVRAACATFAQNSVDVLTDCPGRERAGWLCDGFWSGRSEKLMTGFNYIERNFLENYALCPKLPELPEGMIPMCYPSDATDGIYIPNWAMWYVEEYYDFVTLRGGDLRDVTRPKLLGLIEYFKKYENSDGLLENLDSWIFVEWSEANSFVGGVNYPSNMLYSDMLKKTGYLLKDDELVKKGERVKQTVLEQSFNGRFFVDNALRDENGVLKPTGNMTETCQYYAFYFNVATRESHPELYDTMLNEFGPKRDSTKVYPNVYRSNAFIGNYLRLDYFIAHGERAKVIEECVDFFYYMAERTGTLWEHSQVYASLDHCFASMAAYFIIECVTGFVDFDASKKKIYVTKPVLNEEFDAYIPVGDKRLRIRRKDGLLKIDAPEGYGIENVD